MIVQSRGQTRSRDSVARDTVYSVHVASDPRQPLQSSGQNHITDRMNPSFSNTTDDSEEGAGPGSAPSMRATLIQAFNLPVIQTPQQVVLDGVSVSHAHVLGATPQHAEHVYSNSLGIQPLQMFFGLVPAQMKQFVEQRGPAQANHERMGQWLGLTTW